MKSSAGLPTWVEWCLIGMALIVSSLAVLWLIAMALSVIGVPLPSLEGSNS